MKLLAMRFGEDEEDIALLLRETGVRSTDEALGLLEHLYPALEPPLRTRLNLDEVLGPGAPAD
jgi:hypothetical protein